MQNRIIKYRNILINVSKGSKKDARRYANKMIKESNRLGRGIRGSTKSYRWKRGKRDSSGI